MKHTQRLYILLLLTIPLFFVNNHALQPDIMECRNLVTAREMATEGNWLAPTMNGQPRLEKPPLPTWIAATVEKVSPDDIVLQRNMAALAGVLLIVYFFLFCRRVTGSERYAFVAAVLLMTCYNTVLLSRRATWDIYCHAFMMAGIYYLYCLFYDGKRIWTNALAGGIMFGLSFLSKGPVSFYALLLPFLLALLTKPRPTLQGKKRAVGTAIVLAIVIGSAWYLYLLCAQSDAFQQVAAKESSAWTNHNVRPWYYYWRFFLETGIWAPLMLASLAVPYWRKRTAFPLTYLFALTWIAAQLVLLSLLPEKKMRYLFPMMIPCCMAMAVAFCSLLESHRTAARRTLMSVVALFIIVALFLLPYISKAILNPERRSIAATREMVSLRNIPFYYNDKEEMPIEVVYAAGRKIEPLTLDSATIVNRAPCVLVIERAASDELPPTLKGKVRLTKVGDFNDDTKPVASRHHSRNFRFQVWCVEKAKQHK